MIFKKILKHLSRFRREESPQKNKNSSLFSDGVPRLTRSYLGLASDAETRISALLNLLPKEQNGMAANSAMDSALGDVFSGIASLRGSASPVLADWYTSHSFIGYPLCAIMAQQWMIDRACSIAARDSTRNGFDIVSENGENLDDDVAKTLKLYDKKYRIKWNCEQFVRQGRVFGIRIAYYDISSTDPDFYEKPFNPDGITPGSYNGIVQVDPYWVSPELVGKSISDPSSRNFYEPTYWRVSGKRIHRSHIRIFRHREVPDLLKPSYLYGGIPLPQLIMERVMAAERVANEMPLLALSKRSTIWLTDMAQLVAKGNDSIEKIRDWIATRDNHGIRIGEREVDQFQQIDTSLADLDNVVMTSYQIVAAASGIPATKLLGTAPKGFNSTGEYDARSYAQELESIQEHDLTEFVGRHHLCVMRSFIPKEKWVDVSVSWRPVDSPTSVEIADLNMKKAQIGQTLIGAQAITPEDERRRVASDPDSGYHQIGVEHENDSELLRSAGLSEDVVDLAMEDVNGEGYTEKK